MVEGLDPDGLQSRIWVLPWILALSRIKDLGIGQNLWVRSRTAFILESSSVDILSAEIVGGVLDPIPCILVRFHL